MKFNRVWLRIMQRRFERWLQSLFAPTPNKRTVTVPEYNGWTATQRRLEEESYLANPHAVWLKPDRFEAQLWMEGIWARAAQEETIYFPSAYAQWSADKAKIVSLEQRLNMAQMQNAASQSMLAQMQAYNHPSALQQQAGYGLNTLFGNLLGPRL